MRILKTLAFLFLFFFSIIIFAQVQKPVILSFDSHIQVHKNADLTVTEQIVVRSYGRVIKHGIYRDFPTEYKDKNGFKYHIRFTMLKATLDGQPSAYHLRNLNNGVRIYIGNKSKRVGAGEHAYSLTYRVNREIGFFKDHDELYWNVTGNGWRFPIESASAFVQLPLGASEAITGMTAYTGKFGARGDDYTVTKSNDGVVHYTTTKPLHAKEGLTIVLGWKKGFVTEPTQWQQFQYLLQDNRLLIIAFGGLLILLFYYILVWSKVGKDPKKGVIIPLFEPPLGFSPAGLRYVMGMGYDNKVLTAAVVNMAVKGYIKIEQTAGRKYILHRGEKNDSVLTEPEKALATELFKSSQTLTLKKENASIMQAGIKAFRSALKNEYTGQFFVLNTRYFIIGLVLSVLCLVPVFLLTQMQALVFIFPFFFAGVFLLPFIAKTGGISPKRLMGANLGSSVFILIWIFFMFKGSGLSFGLFVLIFCYFLLNFIFYFLLKRPTEKGGLVINKAKGFKQFLEATEKDRLNFRNPPERTPALFEKYLPYAMALGVDQKWGAQFTNVFASMKEGVYHPAWLMGVNYAHFSMGNFGSEIGSQLNSAIASASTPPGSSSGFSGGGSSGGGGGGGGGGGW